jgi:hypothetical protein
MADPIKGGTVLTPEERRIRSERLNTIMWAYVCGAITLLCYVVGYERSFIPLFFGVLGSILNWQLMQRGEQRHSVAAGALTLGGLMIWATYNWAVVKKFL